MILVDDKQARKQYQSQKAGASRRGIAWEFTYESWVDFWGDDLKRRGNKHHSLCMQRFSDAGPYSPTNVKKDYAKENARTRGVLTRAKNINKRQTKEDWAAITDVFLRG